MNTRRYIQQVTTEPYRIFFIMALIAGVIGVSLWPLFYTGHLSFYPSFAHARLMIEGFVGGFAIGFIGTALPKMLGTAALRVWQVALLFTLYLALCTLHATGHVHAGDAVFATMVAIQLSCMATRIRSAKLLPPPTMLLTAIGLLCGLLGALWWAFFTPFASFTVNQFFQKLLYQAFILLPILGVGTFVFPMILNTKARSAIIPRTTMNRQWRNKALEATAVGLLIITTYGIEVQGHSVAMSWTRFIICAAWLSVECSWLTSIFISRGIMPLAIRLGIVCLLSAFIAAALVQSQRIAMDHILYISGFGLITMTVATRVIFGHSGQGEQFQKWVKSFCVCVALLLLGMATRVSADFLPDHRSSHHIYAAICWIVVSIIWGIAILPSVRKTPPVTFRLPPTAKSLLDLDFRIPPKN